ncbi:perlucin-like protein [Patiria miniata]|uniref:C-type lectin n=1 Tax=Patiria miniata TaxID=46514 RepID=A0A914BEE5_PATMI|nr:perlucin-like protein [Patiria miniata]
MAKMGRALALLLAVATTVSAQTTQPCPSGWRAFNGNCYYFGDMKYWTEARDDCLQRGAGLAIITDSATNDYIANMGKLENHVGTYDTQFWLGLNDRATEGDFRWTDGSKPTYENWAPGEPNNSGDEDCAQIYVNSKEWNDAGCSSAIWHYVCQLNYDVDECANGLDNCDPNASCTNTPGGFTCACNAGYTGDGTTCTADDTFLCSDGQTIPKEWACDRTVDCPGAEDELNCGV